MPGPSDSLRSAIIEHFYRGNSQAARGATLFAAMHTGDPGRTGANEKTGDGASRVAVSFDAVGGDGATDAVADVLFPVNSGAATYNITHIALWDAASAGNYHDSAAITGGSKAVAVGSQLRVPESDLDLVGV